MSMLDVTLKTGFQGGKVRAPLGCSGRRLADYLISENSNFFFILRFIQNSNEICVHLHIYSFIHSFRFSFFITYFILS